MTEIITNIELAARELSEGNVIALPTETVYGLGANALNESAVLKIYEVKDRPRFNPVIVHVASIEDFGKYSTDVNDDVYKLAEKFSPGPLTFILKKNDTIPLIVTAGSDYVALRIPSHPLFSEILKMTGLPIAAPSANRFGKISPTDANEVLSELDGKIRYIFDGGKCRVGIESTIVSFVNEIPEVIRYGAVTKEEMENVTGKKFTSGSGKISAPGQLKIHYAPSTPLYMVNDFDEARKILDKKAGFLDFGKYRDMNEIALNLYSDLRKLDESNFDLILYKEVDNTGLGIAINDRLNRASAGKLFEN